MRKVPQATPITLTSEERRALEALAGSRKSEARMRDRARIVLLAVRYGVTRDCPGSGVHTGHGLEMAGPLCQRENGRYE